MSDENTNPQEPSIPEDEFFARSAYPITIFEKPNGTQKHGWFTHMSNDDEDFLEENNAFLSMESQNGVVIMYLDVGYRVGDISNEDPDEFITILTPSERRGKNWRPPVLDAVPNLIKSAKETMATDRPRFEVTQRSHPDPETRPWPARDKTKKES